MAGWIQHSDHIRYPIGTDSLVDSPAFGLRLGMGFESGWGFELSGEYSPTKEGAGAKNDVKYMGGAFNIMYTPITRRGRSR